MAANEIAFLRTLTWTSVFALLFVNGTSAQEWKWSAVKAVPVTEEEKFKYPIPKQPGKFYEWRMDMNSMQHFDEREFIDALEYVGLIG